jgi:hypothetical protein
MTLEDWRDLALFLADCEAATAYHALTTKSVSKSERRRHLSICEKAEYMLEHGVFIGRRRPQAEVWARLKELKRSATEAARNGK